MLKKTILFFTCLFAFNSHATLKVTNSSKICSEYNFLKSNNTIFEDILNNKVNEDDFKKLYMLDDKVKNKHYLSFFQIIDNKLYTSFYGNKNRTKFSQRVLEKTLLNIIATYKIPNTSFIISIGDGAPNLHSDISLDELNIPIFVFSRKTHQNMKYIAIPDLYMLNAYKWDKLYNDIVENNKNKVWEIKSNKIFWRGANTGASYGLDNWYKIQRLTLALLSKIYPELIDAGFTNIVNAQFADGFNGLALKYSLKLILGDHYKMNSVKEIDHINYKYLVSIDGNSSAWKRVPWIMLSNSILLKQKSINEQWFYPALKNGENYIEIANDLSDIFTKLQWLNDNDEKAKIIANNATKFIENNMRTEDLEKQLLYFILKQNESTTNNLNKPILPITR